MVIGWQLCPYHVLFVRMASILILMQASQSSAVTPMALFCLLQGESELHMYVVDGISHLSFHSMAMAYSCV